MTLFINLSVHSTAYFFNLLPIIALWRSGLAAATGDLAHEKKAV
jgi:hypothetical protein